MPNKHYLISTLVFIIFCGALALGWHLTNKRDITVIDEQAVQQPPAAPQEGKPVLRIAVGAMVSPKDTIRYYGQLIQYIGEHTGYAIELVQRKTYAEINEMLLSGSIDLAFICSGPYTLASTQQRVQILATPLIQGSHLYYAYLIVHKDSAYQTLDDLKGTRFAFTDPDSNTGCLVPRYWLAQKQTSAAQFFSKTLFTYSHDNSIMAVAKGLADGAAVDSLIWDYYHRTMPEFTQKTRIIYRSEGYGIPPVVASPFVDATLQNKISAVVLAMHDAPDGKNILESLFIDRFVIPQQDWYTSIRSMYTLVNTSE